MGIKPRCGKCATSDEERRYLKIKTDLMDRIFCDRCVYDSYITLTLMDVLTPELKELLRRFRKFLGN